MAIKSLKPSNSLNPSLEDSPVLKLKKKGSFLDDNTPQISGMKGMIRMPNEKISKKHENCYRDGNFIFT